MWGNLAGKLGAKDINATLQKIGNAVAPPAGDDDDYYDDDEGYSDVGEEEGEDAGGGGFGFVSLLTRALDDREEEDESESGEETSEDGEVVDRHQRHTGSTETGEEFLSDTSPAIELPQQVKASGYGEPTKFRQPRPIEAQTDPITFDMSNSASSSAPKIAHPRRSPLDSTDPGNEKSDGSPSTDSCSFGGHVTEKVNPQPYIQPDVHQSVFVTTIDKEDPNRDSENRLARHDNRKISPNESSRSADADKGIPSSNRISEKSRPENDLRRSNDKGENHQHEKLANDQKTGSTDPVFSITREMAALSGASPESERRADSPRDTMTAEKSWEQLLERKSNTTPRTEQKNSRGNLSDCATKSAEVGLHGSAKTLETGSSRDNPDIMTQKTVRPREVADPESVEAKPTFGASDRASKAERAPESLIHEGRSVQSGETLKSAQNKDSGMPQSTESQRLREQLRAAQGQILDLKKEREAAEQKSQSAIEKLMLDFQKKEARLLEAANEENQHETKMMQETYRNEIHELEERVARERLVFIEKEEHYRQLVEQRDDRLHTLEEEMQSESRNFENQIKQAEQRQHRLVLNAEEKVAQSMALMDEKEDQIRRLQSVIRGLESSMDEHVEGAEEAEEEVIELQTENERLQELVNRLQSECATLRSHATSLEADAEQLAGFQMELTLLREDRDRLRAQNQAAAESAVSSQSQLESARDAALAETRDVKRQLAAALADLEIAQTDRARIFTANQNLEGALEAFQMERQAELDMLEEQRSDAEDAIRSAHATSVDAIRQTHEADLRQIQQAADSAVKTMMGEIKVLEGNLEKERTENSQTRRSLDEAIHRLQTTQEDVIDRTLMKNILLDWCTMKDKDKRHQVLELMANVLHFTDDEREKVHLTHLDIESVRARVVGALAAPLPPANADKIEGSNVQEKWISFLLSETDDGF